MVAAGILILMRHGAARGADAAPTDFRRPLTPQGHQDCVRIADKLSALNLKPDRVLASPAVRARQTAEIVAVRLSFPIRNITWEDSLYSGSRNRLFELIQDSPAGVVTQAVFGHNPIISELAAQLTHGRIHTLPPAGCLVLEFDTPEWQHPGLAGGVVRCLLRPD